VINNPVVPAWNKLRVVILYALRYQKTQTGNIAALINLLLSNGVSREEARVSFALSELHNVPALIPFQLVYVFLNVAGSDQRQDDLFSTESLLAKGRSALKGLKVFKTQQCIACHTNSVQGVENVYTQHTPHLSQTLENLFKGRLKDTAYPFLDGTGTNMGLQR
jgi:cytochrome c